MAADVIGLDSATTVQGGALEIDTTPMTGMIADDRLAPHRNQAQL